MQGLLVVTHGSLAEELLQSVGTIVGSTEGMAAVCLDWDDDVDHARRQIQESIERLDCGGGVVVVTDMFGGTPSNLALSLLDRGRVEVVTGVNLPMLIKFTTLRGVLELPQLAEELASQGRESIQVASSLLHGQTATGESG